MKTKIIKQIQKEQSNKRKAHDTVEPTWEMRSTSCFTWTGFWSQKLILLKQLQQFQVM